MSQNSKESAADSARDVSDPMVVRQLTPDITTLSVPFTKAGILKTGGRATLGN